MIDACKPLGGLPLSTHSARALLADIPMNKTSSPIAEIGDEIRAKHKLMFSDIETQLKGVNRAPLTGNSHCKSG